MIYIFTSTYYEGEYLIKKLDLKKDTSIYKFQVFSNNSIKLTITGMGKIKSAAAVMYIFTKYEPSNNDFLINYGLCGTGNSALNIGDTFLCNKIIDNSTGKTYYPDILYKNQFKESSVETFDYIVNDRMLLKAELADMEASGIYQSALYFIKVHQMLFIKTVSDFLDGNSINKELLKDKIKKASDETIKFIDNLNKTMQKEEAVLSPKDIELIESLSSNLKFSVSMKNELARELSYYKLTQGSIPETLNKYVTVACSSKKEGKEYVKSIRNALI